MSLRDDGYYVIEGRKRDMIIRGGENVYPEMVEDKLKEHPDVEDCAVVGMPDPGLGERACAIIGVGKGKDTDLERVVGYLKKQGIAVFMLPERIEIVNEWPLTAVGKIDKGRLQAYVTTKPFKEGRITKELGNEYLMRDKTSIDDVIKGKTN